MYEHLQQTDNEVYELVKKETERQQHGLVMIPSENAASVSVLETMGTALSNKYAEGYPGKRYYTGNEYIDQIENLAIDRAKKLFNAEHANVQPNAGSGANLAIYFALLKPGDTVMGLNLAHGGHLTHGNPVNFSGMTYRFVSYGVNKETERIDLDEVRTIALREKPKMIVTGATAYPRQFDFEAFRKIADEVGAYLLADVSHFVGLCLAGVHPAPFPYADVVMTTTHKTLRGPRSAIILSKTADRLASAPADPAAKTKNLAQKIDSAVFPGTQGGPMEHIIAAKAVCFAEAMKPEFKIYQENIVKNAHALAKTLQEEGIRLVSGGTDNHLMLIDCTPLQITGKQGANALAELGIYTNFNTIPYDTRKPFDPSGIRLGTPTLTTRGMGVGEMQTIGRVIAGVLKNMTNETVREGARSVVQELTSRFPLYDELI
ncbi:MAG: Serine hydroxymethyltransferase [Candidatus Magasanikbacteria bacterium GW2011_GWA2_45_39]|uniref:Serine hydroxymethyltransferase n=2 Tax=Candidatus Magasanikiibacteriota TaxID=1752731 RepID=A0A0G1MZF0_9BACT|nr:MAG: Serine hydroxymethyltransferase [Candidatus Magasanikbacteria bacterium GW2011_GWA2_45_39]KKU13594.1 MAG: Serine hydroxymethyltransferase [Candidatus Magasanikbacteria bacterium GW2011_GWC2_45_8]